MALAYISAGIESDLHAQITKEAARNKQSFSAQIREYRDYFFKGEEKIQDLMIANKELTEELEKERTYLKALKERSLN
jgi:hypothetical protein